MMVHRTEKGVCMSFQDKHIIITGAAGGIGSSLAKKLYNKGANLYLVDLNLEKLNHLIDLENLDRNKVKPYALDITSKKAVMEWASSLNIVPDVVINNAGLGYQAPLEETTLEDWEKLMNVNFWGPLYMTYAFYDKMKKRSTGMFVNVSSGQAFFRMPGWGAYSIIKLAIAAYSELLYFESKKYGIHVLTVYPYMVNTGFYKDVQKDTLGAKFAMWMLPYYSMSADSVADRIIHGMENKSRVEMIHPFNYVGQAMRSMPLVSSLVTTVTDFFLNQSKGGVFENLPDPGFKIDETMTGEHEFVSGEGEPGKKFMEFRATWGPDKLSEWPDPIDIRRLKAPLTGTVTIEGLCENAAIEGTIELRYALDNKIIYDFTFEANGKKYHYIGEKKDIKPWNLPVSHTTCYGVLKEVETGKVISRSITHFRMETMPSFLGSFRLV
ncbi:MAG: SDR family NAD(P)-dependent oxidoreductase [Candidatus Hydrogenedentota bacterium]|nr:MAG: SDR family NAD(P)-dependent oxidoreductase [Candidatus Hydrogenedentota bacterium]